MGSMHGCASSEIKLALQEQNLQCLHYFPPDVISLGYTSGYHLSQCPYSILFG